MNYKLDILCFFLRHFVLVSANTIEEFFPGINGNLTKITWAHAVNSKSYLLRSLNSSVMMLEADVIYGRLIGSGNWIPIMGHPPAIQSDLSLEDFLTTTYNFNKDPNNLLVRKGVKLDFKSTDVFTKSIDLIKKLYALIDYPIWINADIIRGPLNILVIPVNAKTFLANAKIFNKSVLSLGWTTLPPLASIRYTDKHIRKMVEAIKTSGVQQNITFAVRAGIAAQSLNQLRMIKDEINYCTLTIWSSTVDEVDVPKLRALIFEYEISRVYIDVPKKLYDRLDLGN